MFSINNAIILKNQNPKIKIVLSNKLSNRSRNPPCPGINFPVSLTFESLLKYEISISPNWLADEIIKIIM